MIQWIFFDVGNVILNDDPAMAFFYYELDQAIQENGKHVTLDEILAAREYSILIERNGNHYEAVGKRFLDERTWQKVNKKVRRILADRWSEFCPLIPGIVPIIQTLADQFNLGLIANQPGEVIDVLKGHGLLHYFKIHGISQLVGFSKPDLKLFYWTLEKANCKPGETVMIGDRIDNDIRPANSIGMNTLWLKLPLSQKNYQPITAFEGRYFESLKRASASHSSPQEAGDMPDAMAEDFRTILTEINRLKSGPIML